MEIFQPLVTDQRLRQLCHPMNNVDQIEDHAPLRAHHQVEIAKADVEIDDDDLLPFLCECGA